MLEVLSWIDPLLVGALKIVDRFPDIHDHGRVRIERELKQEIIRLHGHVWSQVKTTPWLVEVNTPATGQQRECSAS